MPPSPAADPEEVLRWILPEHGPAGLLVEAINLAAHDIEDLIDNLSATVVSKEAYDAMEAVHRDFTCVTILIRSRSPLRLL